MNNGSINAESTAGADENKYIVGIGASAGGLEALQTFLQSLPSNTGFPYIIIQHLSPDYKSLLGEILGKYTEMPVIQVEDGMDVRPDCVYVIQPGKNMRIEDGKLHLTPQREKELNLPIDMFLRSLAVEAGPRAIAVILSGTGSDGSNGIKDIKEHDGMIIVQSLESSKFDGMPRSAMRTGLVDAQLSPSDIALELRHISDAASKHPSSFKSDREIDEELMKRIYLVLKKVSNINFTHYKQTTILRRIERRMMLVHKETLSDYVDFLHESPDEVKTLSKEVLIGVTNFFRDPDYFQSLKDIAIKDILLHSIQEEPIRVWVAGCSTGEEAYSIAILFCELMDSLKLKRTVKIFATDLDAEAISTASKGIYGDNIIDSVSPSRLSRYFSRKNNLYSVNRDIRKMIVFSPHNVFQDPPFGKLDLISCRNMLIYFQPVLQNDLFAIFHSALKRNGYLFLGKSEAIGAFTDAFPVVDAAAKIFSHNSDVRIPGQKSIPYLQAQYMEDDFYADADARYNRGSVPAELTVSQQDTIDTDLLEQFMPACLVVNEKNDIVHIYGESANYVHMPVGRFTNSLFELITESLKIPVSTLLKEAREKKRRMQYRDIVFNGETEQADINLTAMPITRSSGDGDNLYALIFSEKSQRGELPDAVSFDIETVATQRITDLEQELGEVQGKLDRSVAEQECVNEELQAANEELLTANEELQSSNEELQSVNEELYTVNSEYQQKLSELADLNDDIANFLSSTLTGIIFVDNKLNIRRYTDYVTTEFSVMEHDIGRSLKFISYHFPSVDITEICGNVLKTLVPDEREITTTRRKVFFMRVAPYRSTENKILGCVITLVDITTQKQGQNQLADTEKQLSIAQNAAEAKSDYLSRIVHEIRTPMSTLQGLISLTGRQHEEHEDISPSIEKMAETLEYMSSVVADISEESKLERNCERKYEAFGLRNVLSDIMSQVKSRAESEGLTLELSLADGFDPVYRANRSFIRQILVNLLNNAVKYTPSGGNVMLKAFEDEESPDNERKASLYFVVSDTGIGIKRDFIPLMFKPFTRAFNDDAAVESGLGLGLSIANNLIKSMNGEITVESEEGKGSTFTVHLIVDRNCIDSDAEASPQAPLRASAFAGRNILVAEDNALNRTILCSILSREGMVCVEAEDGEEAVKLFIDSRENTYDCILMDMRMPKLDGIKATALIRDSGRSDAKTIPIIGVSANGFAEDIRKAKEAGINEYTTKPIDRDNLLTAMSVAMNCG